MQSRWELVVVGAGPVGLAATRAAARFGMRVALIDERRTLGGSVCGDLGASALHADGCWLTPAWGDAAARAALTPYLEDHGAARVVSDALAWGLFAGWTLAVSRDGATERFDADAIILATGSYVTRPVFPGHHLPGVVTPLGLQRALETGAARAGERLVVIGAGPRVDALLANARAAGLEVVAQLSEQGGDGAAVRRLVAPPRAAGAQRLQHLDAPCAEGEQRLAVDWCCVAGPESVASELANMAGVRVPFRGYQRGYLPEHGPDGATEAPGLFVAAASANAAALEEALRQGERVGTAAALRAGRATASDAAAAVAALHFVPKSPPAPVALTPMLGTLPHPDGVACHCTGHTLRDVLGAIEAGARSLDDIKRQAKVGLGPCQGRDCHRLVTRALELHGEVDTATLHALRARAPIRPLTAAAMFERELGA
jgi:D-hydroxyproline dehydrogenase subunit alpha